MSCILIAFCHEFIVSSPPSLPIDSESTDDPVIVCYAKDPFLSAKQPGKQTPLTHAYIAYSLSLLLALDFAIVITLSYSDA